MKELAIPISMIAVFAAGFIAWGENKQKIEALQELAKGQVGVLVQQGKQEEKINEIDERTEQILELILQRPGQCVER